ncbi:MULTISPECIES: methylated-DNA--[protein]-cysteine S-methyltransferase [Pseudonocardia]|uniref:Methylated-DNA--protein-cysteine methyltransferase n=2 Tax=Pseudonocardia TaxID=1847 RepID=A0A1Y2MZZ7_PSEAH|nr:MULTISPECIES: methylated-DNA--[protein]-cysteine S-methyltransferase [Pseudonocardia]OSY40774.1 Methylated-DNA--protein-cysteine methyltransferase [Pseudonocardia autotrophica]TDN71919.1 methylated-DNA-[protein]-cysteine S-methyltransferase [Pseudonocardia autotrophica]BBG02606.1 methylated-DNA--protein-cysteine methyltransferase [Pseudonocardia autotrophica]GEC24665.1 methylated-DNA--protein-cysteine methyltransferase [Pseudonocardia saturnea]
MSIAATTARPTVVQHTTLGPITLSASPQGLTRLRLGRTAPAAHDPRPEPAGAEHALLEQAVAELGEYLLGRRTTFTVPVDLSGVEPEHRRVLDELCAIGYGHTRSYGELARAAGLTEDGPRRAGAACARNPVLLVIPCHRIVSAGGALTGYAGGLPVKKALLALERGQFPLDADDLSGLAG